MNKVDSTTLKILLTEARSHNGWRPDPVSDAELENAYEIAKFGPTSMNTQPMRIVFLRTDAAKERLRPALAPGNVEKTMTAPVVAIIAYDTAFYTRLPTLFPHKPDARALFEGKEALIEGTAFRNGTLQGAYFLLALRAQGLDVGPMSGFDPLKVNQEFFAGTTLKSNFLCGIGHGNPEKLFARSPRLSLAEISQIL
jgi:3-hydroxypropanoate dehydrogenase